MKDRPMTGSAPATTPEDPLAKSGRQLEILFAFLFWAGAIWLFAESYVPLKQFTVAWLSGDLPAFRQAVRGILRFALQSLPIWALLAAVYQARRLFAAVAAGEILTAANGRLLQGLGTALVVAAALLLFGGTTFGADDGGRHGGPLLTTDVVLGAVGFAIHFIGQAWARAAEAQSELDQIV
jgi:hypothetical protein